MKSLTLLLGALTAFAAQALTYQVEMSNKDGVYAAGEKVPLTITAFETNDVKAVAGTLAYSIDNYGSEEYAKGTVDLAKANPFVIEVTKDDPGIARLTLEKKGEAKFVWGVAFSPEKIKTGSARPDDFDAFWAAAKAKYDREVPVDVKLEKIEKFCNAKQNVYRLSLTTPGGRTVDGILGEPADLTKGPFPVRMLVPGAGPSYGCAPKADGKIHLTMNVHFYPLVVGQHKHSKPNDELLALEKVETAECKAKYNVRRYPYAGLAVSREEYHFYDCILAVSRALDWLCARPEVKTDDVRYNGTSQGGGFGLILSGFNTHLTRTIAYVPAMTDTLACLDHGRKSGWPQIVENIPGSQRSAVEKNAPYFDAAHFAARIKIPIRVVVGLSDPTCPPAAVWAGYNAIPSSDKAIKSVPGMTHSVHKDVYQEMNAWLER